jgi:type I restriction enzyme S subunit
MSFPAVPLGELIRANYGKSLKKDERDETGTWDVFGSSGVVGKHNQTLTDSPTIIIGRKGSVGAITYAPRGGWTIDTAFFVEILIPAKLDFRYLYYALVRAELDKHTITTSIPGINRNDIYETQIPLPPLVEQKRIAAILDKADAIRKKRQQAIALTEDFLRSAFLEMFGDPVMNPKGWKTGYLGDVIYSTKDGPHVSPKYAQEGIPILSTRHIKQTGVVWQDLKYIDEDEAARQWKKCKPERGDVLYTKGGTTGIAAHVDFDKEIAVWVHIALLKTNHEVVSPVWLATMLNTSYCYAQSQGFTHGATNKDLGLKRMVKIKMYLPPLAEQMEFQKLYEKNKSNLDKQNIALKESHNFFNSLVQGAFRGDL